jgi:hypothetical protein
MKKVLLIIGGILIGLGGLATLGFFVVWPWLNAPTARDFSNAASLTVNMSGNLNEIRESAYFLTRDDETTIHNKAVVLIGGIEKYQSRYEELARGRAVKNDSEGARLFGAVEAKQAQISDLFLAYREMGEVIYPAVNKLYAKCVYSDVVTEANLTLIDEVVEALVAVKSEVNKEFVEDFVATAEKLREATSKYLEGYKRFQSAGGAYPSFAEIRETRGGLDGIVSAWYDKLGEAEQAASVTKELGALGEYLKSKSGN